jgi:hypothetical protein
MKNSNFIIFFFLSFVVISCTIKGNFKGLYSYYDSTKIERPEMLISVNNSTLICEIKQTTIPTIYVINGIQLKECLNVNPKALIYMELST